MGGANRKLPRAVKRQSRSPGVGEEASGDALSGNELVERHPFFPAVPSSHPDRGSSPRHSRATANDTATMRVTFSASWIFQGWIAILVLIAVCTQARLVLNCLPNEYGHNRVCCSKCEPGKYVTAHCTGNSATKCLDCGRDEFQPDWNSEDRCFPQKFCDEGKGFNRTRPHNPRAPEPCRCKQGFHCSVINCEYCEAIEKCPAGEGVKMGETGRASCVPCPYGFFSDILSIDGCKKWTDCKLVGKTVKQPGNSRTDVLCGLPSPGSITPWLVVAILSVIIVVSLVLLLLFCCKDKLNFLSVNLRSCVQNLKGSRNQQETHIHSYHSSHTIQSYPLICQEKTPSDFQIRCPSTRITIFDQSSICRDHKPDQDATETMSANSAEDSMDAPASPLSGSSCSCWVSKEPIEVGENEDCSQLVATGLETCCTCRMGDAVSRPRRHVAVRELEEPLLCDDCSCDRHPVTGSECGCADHQGSQELYLDYTGPPDKEEMRTFPVDEVFAELQYRQNEPCCCSIDSTVVPPLPSVSDDEHGLSLIHKLPESDADPEDQNHFTEACLMPGQVTGNNNTTFISSGQVMNFSGEVIVVYVSQTSLGSVGCSDEPFSCPVQEESNEENVPSDFKSMTPQLKSGLSDMERLLPVQEVTSN